MLRRSEFFVVVRGKENRVNKKEQRKREKESMWKNYAAETDCFVLSSWRVFVRARDRGL